MRASVGALVALLTCLGVVRAPVPAAAAAIGALDRTLDRLVTMPEGPPGVIVLIQRGNQLAVHSAGVGNVATGRPPGATDTMRVASVAKAFSGAVALSLVQRGILGLDDTIGQRRPDLPASWHDVTLRRLLSHTGDIPDFATQPATVQAIVASLGLAPEPRQLLDFVAPVPLTKPAGRYRYSNSDNIVVGLMVEAATGRPYEVALREEVTQPLSLGNTRLPRGTNLDAPFIHGYDIDDARNDEDVSELLAAGWAWASGGVVSTPLELNRFIRGYVGGALFGDAVRTEQRRFIRGGGSEPLGPGRNAAGLALFRYRTRCGTVYGHTGNTVGFTQFAAASSDGSRSVTVSMNVQRTHENDGASRRVFRTFRRATLLAVCAAFGR